MILCPLCLVPFGSDGDFCGIIRVLECRCGSLRVGIDSASFGSATVFLTVSGGFVGADAEVPPSPDEQEDFVRDRIELAKVASILRS